MPTNRDALRQAALKEKPDLSRDNLNREMMWLLEARYRDLRARNPGLASDDAQRLVEAWLDAPEGEGPAELAT